MSEVTVYPQVPSEVAVFPPEDAAVVVQGQGESTLIVTPAGAPGPAGPPGPPGADSTVPGPQGPPGAPGSAPQAYEHDQVTPATVWTVVHNLGYRPNVLVKDSAGTTQLGETDHVSINELTITFLAAFGGKAYLS